MDRRSPGLTSHVDPRSLLADGRHARHRSVVVEGCPERGASGRRDPAAPVRTDMLRLAMRPVRPSRLPAILVAPVARRLLRLDLPALPDPRRHEVVEFTCRRVEQLPDATRVGVLAVAVVYRVAGMLPGGGRVLAGLARHRLPVLGEYPRLVRSLSVAYVFETWPDTRHDGAPA